MSALFHPYLCGRIATEWLIYMVYLIGAILLFVLAAAAYTLIERFFWYIVGFFGILLVLIIFNVIQHKRKKKQIATAEQERKAKLQQEAFQQQQERENQFKKELAAREQLIATKMAEFDSELEAIERVPPVISKKVPRKKQYDMPDIAFKNITRRTPIDKLFPLVAIDVETTGIKTSGNDIIEVSAIKYDTGFSPVSCFTTLCKPRKPIPQEASAINKITDEMVADAPVFGCIAESLSAYISDCTIIGHNLSFDIRFLFVSGIDFSDEIRYYDTLDLAQKVLSRDDVDNYKLDTLCRYYGIYRGTSHRSLSDCYATGKLFKALIEDKTS